MSKHETAQIYGLVDPRDRLIHYAGSAVDAIVRLDGHLNDGEDTSKTRWIAELKALGLRPEIAILATVPIADRFKEEYKWIYLGKVSGWPLTNTVAMKSQKYTGLADEAGNVLVVEIDNGLTWRKVKRTGVDVWTDSGKWLVVAFRLVMTATILMMVSFGIGAYANWAESELLYAFGYAMLIIATLLYMPVAIHRLCDIAYIIKVSAGKI